MAKFQGIVVQRSCFGGRNILLGNKMSGNFSIEDLEQWDRRVFEKVEASGLDCYPQLFEICDHNQMLSSMSYSGMPSHYPHWSYGKMYEKQKTLYDYGVTGLPYEMVINSNPCLAYLMRDNSLLLQILTIAHVYAHNDFFKNNFTFRSARAEYTLDTFKAHGDRVRGYIEDPSISLDKVEAVLDAAHSVSLQCRRNLMVRKRSYEEERQALMESSLPPHDPFQKIHRRAPFEPPDLNKVPPAPDEDLLLFLRDHNPNFAEWEKDVLTIVHDEAQYFIPQIETKIMNEGWATFWHKFILDSMHLPQELRLEFMVRHSQVVRPFNHALNPYHIGLLLWRDIFLQSNNADPTEFTDMEELNGNVKLDRLFEVRESDRDSSFIRRHLTEKLMRELGLFKYEIVGDQKIVRNIADAEGWRQVKEALLKNVGMNSIPVIKVEDADFGHNHTLYLVHDHDGRDLELEYAEKTLSFLARLWWGDVVLETMLNGNKYLLVLSDGVFTAKNMS
jgi:stage V sporulation protein R